MADETDRATRLFIQAHAEGELSESSAQALLALDNIAEEAGRAIGVPGRGSGDLLLVTLLVDDSSSIANISYGAEAVRQGHNICIDALGEQSGAEILVCTRYLNKGLVSPYCPLGSATRLTSANYVPEVPHTPLFRQTVTTLGAVMAKAHDEGNKGRAVRAFTLIVSDSGDNASGDITASHAKFIVRDLLEFTDQHIIAGFGIGRRETFMPTFGAMGIPSDWILAADATKADIQALFRRIARQLALAASSQQQFREIMPGPA